MTKGSFSFLTLFAFLLLSFNSETKAQNPFFKRFDNSSGLPGNSCHTLLVDNNDNLWVGTNKGLAVYRNNRFYIPNQPHALKKSNVMELALDEKGMIWAVTSGGEVFAGNVVIGFNRHPISSSFSEVIKNRIVNSFIVGPQNQLVVGSVIGGGAYSDSLNNFSSLFTSQGNHSYFIKEYNNNKWVWGSCGSFPPNNVLKIINKNGGGLSVSLSSKSGFSKSSFSLYMNNKFIYAKDYEMILFREEQVEQRSFLPQRIECVFTSKENKVWVGMSKGGVICFLTENLSTDVSNRYLSNESITAIAESKGHDMWFATQENGVYMLPGNSGFEDNSQNRNTPSITPDLAKQEPLIPETLFRPTPENALSAFKNQLDSTKPVVYISKIEINNRDTAIENMYHLNYNQNYINIQFSGLVNNQPDQLQYRYRLEGFNQDWVYSDVPNAQFGKLPPGDYVFSVFAMDNEGQWSTLPATTAFVISPPFWNSPVFYTSLVIIILLVLVLALLLGLRQSRRRSEKNKQRLMSELIVLRTQMNPHFTFNTLSSIQNYITKNDNDAAIDYLSKFGKLLRSILENTKKTSIPINDEISALKLYMDLEKLRMNGKFDYEISIDSDIDADYDQIPSMLIQPYVENSIWHGFSNLDREGKIKIQIKRKNDLIICTIEDNGIGRSAAKKLNGNKTHKSMGMEITRERLEIINALKNSPLSVDIQDLHDNEGNASGTKVEIFIPYEED